MTAATGAALRLVTRSRYLCFWFLVMAATMPMPAQAAEIRIVASPSVSSILRQLGPKFESATGHTLNISYGLVAAQKQQIAAGDFDLAIIPEEVMDYEVAQAKISEQTRVRLAQTGLAVGIRAGAPRLDLGTLDSFTRAMLNARSVSYVTKEPSGKKVSQDFEALGIADAMKSKMVSKESTAQVWQAVAHGEAELGFGFTPNVKSATGVDFAGPFPDHLQFYTVIAAGVGATSGRSDLAIAFIKYLTSADNAAVFKTNGFEPVAH